MKAKRWKPKEGGKYWYINTDWITWFNDSIDRKRHKMGNCFKTKKEAERKRKQILKVLKER